MWLIAITLEHSTCSLRPFDRCLGLGVGLILNFGLVLDLNLGLILVLCLDLNFHCKFFLKFPTSLVVQGQQGTTQCRPGDAALPVMDHLALQDSVDPRDCQFPELCCATILESIRKL